MSGSIKDKLTHAYNQMAERFHAALEHTENVTLPHLEEALAKAKDQAVEFGELTREEADKVGQYLQRDLQDLSAYLSDTRKELSQWLAFESTLIEGKVFEWLSLVADKTKLQWDAFNQQAAQKFEYHSGEITGPGTLECSSCQQTLNFKQAGHIPPCPKCHKTRFKRHTK